MALARYIFCCTGGETLDQLKFLTFAPNFTSTSPQPYPPRINPPSQTSYPLIRLKFQSAALILVILCQSERGDPCSSKLPTNNASTGLKQIIGEDEEEDCVVAYSTTTVIITTKQAGKSGCVLCTECIKVRGDRERNWEGSLSLSASSHDVGGCQIIGMSRVKHTGRIGKKRSGSWTIKDIVN